MLKTVKLAMPPSLHLSDIKVKAVILKTMSEASRTHQLAMEVLNS